MLIVSNLEAHGSRMNDKSVTSRSLHSASPLATLRSGRHREAIVIDFLSKTDKTRNNLTVIPSEVERERNEVEGSAPDCLQFVHSCVSPALRKDYH